MLSQNSVSLSCKSLADAMSNTARIFCPDGGTYERNTQIVLQSSKSSMFCTRTMQQPELMKTRVHHKGSQGAPFHLKLFSIPGKLWTLLIDVCQHFFAFLKGIFDSSVCRQGYWQVGDRYFWWPVIVLLCCLLSTSSISCLYSH